jgi:hypothetical protein
MKGLVNLNKQMRLKIIYYIKLIVFYILILPSLPIYLINTKVPYFKNSLRKKRRFISALLYAVILFSAFYNAPFHTFYLYFMPYLFFSSLFYIGYMFGLEADEVFGYDRHKSTDFTRQNKFHE